MHVFLIFAAKYLYLVIALLTIVVLFRLPREAWGWLLVEIGIAALLAVVLTKAAGALYFDTRPYVLQHMAPLIPHHPDNGFPSDHTVVSMLCAALAFRASRIAGCVLTMLAVLVGYARVWAGVHHPVDIAGAVVIAWLAVGLSAGIGAWLRHRAMTKQQLP